MNSVAKRGIQRCDTGISALRTCRAGNAQSGKTRIVNEFVCIVTRVTTLSIDHFQTDESPRHVVVAELLNVSYPTRCDPRPRANWIEIELKICGHA